MRRRDFITLLAGTTTSPMLLTRAVRAQQQATPVIGFLSSRSPAESAGVVAAFRQGLREVGFVEGQNLAIAFRWAEGRYDRLPALAAELVGLGVTLLFAAGGPPAAFAAKGATSSIPIVFSAATDPVRLGLVASLNRPGGNVTGMSTFAPQLGGKSIEILKELKPTATSIAYLANPTSPSADLMSQEARAVADASGIRLHVLNASTENDLDAAFANMQKLHPDGLVVNAEPFFDSRREKIVMLAARHEVATCYPWREYVFAGGLMSYGNNLPELYRQAAIYAGRTLKGEKPADLPVAQPTTFEFVINLKTAKVLGLKVPPMLLARADEVIE